MSVVWGASYLLIKIAIDGGLPAADVAWLRVAVAAVDPDGAGLARGALATLRGRWRWVVAYAVAEISIPFPLIAAGEVHVASSLAAIIIASVPADRDRAVAAVRPLRAPDAEARARPGDRLRRGHRAGGDRRCRQRRRRCSARWRVLVGAVGYAIGPMLVKLGMGGHGLAGGHGGQPAAGDGHPGPVCGRRTCPAGPRRRAAWAAVAALGVFCTAMAFVVYTVLVREAGTGRATIITYINPLVAVVLGVTLLGERPGPGAIAGLVLILAGSWLSTRRRVAAASGAGRGRAGGARPAAHLRPPRRPRPAVGTERRESP